MPENEVEVPPFQAWNACRNSSLPLFGLCGHILPRGPSDDKVSLTAGNGWLSMIAGWEDRKQDCASMTSQIAPPPGSFPYLLPQSPLPPLDRISPPRSHGSRGFPAPLRTNVTIDDAAAGTVRRHHTDLCSLPVTFVLPLNFWACFLSYKIDTVISTAQSTGPLQGLSLGTIDNSVLELL